jgi:hypothetical protein
MVARAGAGRGSGSAPPHPGSPSRYSDSSRDRGRLRSGGRILSPPVLPEKQQLDRGSAEARIGDPIRFSLRPPHDQGGVHSAGLRTEDRCQSAALHGKQRFDAALLLLAQTSNKQDGGATDRQYETVSKTVGGGNVARGFESLPLRFWLGRAKFAADTRVSTLDATSRDRSSRVNERQRTSTTASATGIPLPDRRREHGMGGRAAALQVPPGTQSPPDSAIAIARRGGPAVVLLLAMGGKRLSRT